MEMKALGTRRLKISLTHEELLAEGLEYEQIDSHQPKTRALLLALLDAARLDTSFSPGSRILIEVYPTPSQGCIIYFTDLRAVQAKRWRVRRRKATPVIYAFEDIDTLINATVKLFHRCSHRIRKSALYRMDKSWRLVIFPLDAGETITLAFLDEFAPRCGEGSLYAAWLDEHAERIVAENAVDLLSAYFG